MTVTEKLNRYGIDNRAQSYQEEMRLRKQREKQESAKGMPDSLKSSVGFVADNPEGVNSEAAFDAFFEHAMRETRRSDLVLEYSRLSSTEKSMLVTAIANRGVLDKQKDKTRRKKQPHAYEALRNTMIRNMTDAMRMTGEEIQGNIMAEPDVYAKAAKMMQSAQLSDKDQKTLSKRDSYYDLKLVQRAFKFLAVVRGKANDADMEAAKRNALGQGGERIKGGYDEDKVVDFHENATFKEKMLAAEVSNLVTFTEFYKSLRREDSKNIAAFEAFDAHEKKLFIWALANPSRVVKWVGPLRHAGRHNNKDRQQSKQIFAHAKEWNLEEGDYRKAAMMLLSKDGRHSKSKLSYNQPIVRDAMHYVRATEMTQVTVLRKKHEAAAKNDDNLSGDTKWSATNAIDVRRGQMRVVADRVKDLASFEAFLTEGLTRSGEKYAPLAQRFASMDQRQKATFVLGLSNRRSTEGRTDRSRMRSLQFLGNKFAASSVIDEKKRAEIIERYSTHKQEMERRNEEDREAFSIDEKDYWRAAVNLVSKDTQTRIGNREQHIDVGMVERGFVLIDDAEKGLRKREHKAQYGYGERGTALRAQFAEGSDTHKEKVSNKTYKAFSGATRQNIADAQTVTSMVAFEGFFQALMEQDENTGRWETFASYNHDQKVLFVRALAHRDVIDRNRDHAIVTRYLRLWDLHGYKGRAMRDRLKGEYATAGVEQTMGRNVQMTEPEANEFSAAAFSILSRESRRANWLSTKMGAKVGDDRLIERAMKLVAVADDMRDERQDIARNGILETKKTEAGIIEDERIGKITKRATMEIKTLADNIRDMKTFGQFLAAVLTKDQMVKYKELKPSDRNLFAEALAKRAILDKFSKKQHENEEARIYKMRNSARSAQMGEETADPIGETLRLAAYNVLSSKGRALGTHRPLWIKTGAADEKLVERAFKFVNTTDQYRDYMQAASSDRAQVMQDFGIKKLTGDAKAEQRAQADEMQSPVQFEVFLQERMEALGKEKYSLMFKSYGMRTKQIFTAALAIGNGEKRKQIKGENAVADVLGSYVVGKSERAAAYRLISHRDGDLAALRFARKIAEQSIQEGFAQAQKNDANLTMDSYLAEQGQKQVEIEEATEFDRLGTSTERNIASTGRRKVSETRRNFNTWVKETHAAHRSKVSSIVQNLDDGTFKHGAAKLFLYTMNPFLWGGMNSLNNDKAKADASNIRDRGSFLEYLYNNAVAEKRVSLYNAVKNLKSRYMMLLIQALQDRTLLDDSLDGDSLSSQNDEGRDALTHRFVVDEMLPVGDEEWAAAAEALVSRKVIGKERGMDKLQARATVIDWELLENALGYVQYEARDQRKMHRRASKNGRDVEGQLRRGEDESDPDVFGATVDGGMMGMDAYFLQSGTREIVDHVTGKAEWGYDTTVETVNNLSERAEQLEKILGIDSFSEITQKDFLKDLTDTKNVMKIVERAQEEEFITVIQHAGLRSMNLVMGVINLIKNSVELDIVSYDMHKLNDAADTFDKQMMVEDKVDIIQSSLSEAFEMAREMQKHTLAEKVFGIVDAICGLAVTAGQLVGIPLPIMTVINSIRSFVLRGAKFIVDKIIALCSTDHVQKLLKTKERTHAYNQRVKAYNARPGLPKKMKRDLLTEDQMQKLLLRQSGLKTEQGVRDYICRKTANSMVYAYNGNAASNEHIAAAQLFGGLKIPYTPGGKAPAAREIAMKLRGAK